MILPIRSTFNKKPSCQSRRVTFIRKLHILSSVGDRSLRYTAPTVFGMVKTTSTNVARREGYVKHYFSRFIVFRDSLLIIIIMKHAARLFARNISCRVHIDRRRQGLYVVKNPFPVGIAGYGCFASRLDCRHKLHRLHSFFIQHYF